MTKHNVNGHIEELERNGETYIGTLEILGVDIFKVADRIRKSFEKKHEGFTIAYNCETGYAWVC